MIFLLDALDSDWLIEIKLMNKEIEGWKFFKFEIRFHTPKSNGLIFLYKTPKITC